MRIKSLVAGVGLTVVAALALGPAVASANRGTSPAVEEPAAPAEETPPPAEETPDPVEETPTTTAPEVVEEEPAPPAVEEEPAPAEETPAPTTTTTKPAPVVKAPVVDPAPVVTVEPQEAPARAKVKDEAAKDKAAKTPCHMDDYQAVLVSTLSGDELARAQKVDRNGNGTVCRKDIPGKGRGNTHQNSNIKDDQVR